MDNSVGELVRKAENDFLRGSTKISKHVTFSMHDTLEKIEAYANSKHITGPNDSQGRKKPFFNISTAAVNVWYRATDIDRSDIKIRAVKSKDWLDSFLATVHLQDWMRRENFGQYLNKWGRALAKYGSVVTKFVRNDTGLHISVVPWNTIICDSVDFASNPKIEVLELTESQLKKRIKTHGYDADAVKDLLEAVSQRENLDKQKKDNKTGYVKLYEVHGELPKSFLTADKNHEDTYVQQMHVVSFVGISKGRDIEYKDFTLYRGEEAEDPYDIDHLIEEDGRTLAIGAVENLFEAQWMVNHSQKAIKDTLDITSRLALQTSDEQFIGRNVLNDIETGHIFITKRDMPLTKVEMSGTDIVGWQNYAVAWKQLGNEINGIAEAMLGANQKSGTAWHQTEAVLQESYSLFEVMTENKGLALERMLRNRILPYLKTKMDTAEEVSATLSQYDINRIDSIWIKNKSIDKTNDQILNAVIRGDMVTPELQAQWQQQNEASMRDTAAKMGNQRFFKPSDIGTKTWKEQFKNLEWEVDIDITGEPKNVQEALTTLSTALKLMVTPGFSQNKGAQAIVGRILELSGTMSPIEYAAIPTDTQRTQMPTDPNAINSALPNQQMQ